MFGNDPNWGRIISAMGNSGANFEQSLVEVHFGKECIVANGTATNFNLQKVKDEMSGNYLRITINLKQGSQNAVAYGCDMSYDYVKINAMYTT